MYNPNALATGMPSSNLQPTSSAGNSRGHTPRMVNQPQPFIPHQQNQPPLPPPQQQQQQQQQQQPTPQLPPQGQTPQQVQMGYPKKVNNGNLVANQSLKSGPMGDQYLWEDHNKQEFLRIHPSKITTNSVCHASQ